MSAWEIFKKLNDEKYALLEPELFHRHYKRETLGVPAVQASPGRAGYYRPWRFIPPDKSGISRIVEDSSKLLKISLDVRQIPPDGISVNVAEGKIVVQAKQPETADKIGKVDREYVRTYNVPPDTDIKTMKYEVGKTGKLIITVDKIKKEDDKKK